MSTLSSGVFAPVLTPFHADLSVDSGRFLTLCRRLLDEGCHGLVLFGTTSEANSLSLEEREGLLEVFIEGGVDAGQLIVGTGLCAIPETVRLTGHAVGLGCAGVLILPPFFYKGISDEGLFAAYAEVIERVADDALRIYLYHIPKVSGVAISAELITRLREAYPKTVIGIKDSSGDWQNTRMLLEDFPGFRVFPGNELIMLDALRLGAVGCITATANVNAAGLANLYAGWRGEGAEGLQETASAVRRAVQSQAMVPALKAIIARRNKDDGWLTLRPPFVGLDEERAGALFAALEGAGFTA
jgi:4-hydroxy-tetrahydrodipicolinate synthase